MTEEEARVLARRARKDGWKFREYTRYGKEKISITVSGFGWTRKKFHSSSDHDQYMAAQEENDGI